MSHIESGSTFSGSKNIQELSLNEIDTVNGGLLPILAFAGGILIGAGAAAVADYLNGGFND